MEAAYVHTLFAVGKFNLEVVSSRLVERSDAVPEPTVPPLPVN